MLIIGLLLFSDLSLEIPRVEYLWIWNVNKNIWKMSVIEADPLFTQDIVHDFIISKGGTVTNKILVRHFRSFLNDTTRNGNKVINI